MITTMNRHNHPLLLCFFLTMPVIGFSMTGCAFKGDNTNSSGNNTSPQDGNERNGHWNIKPDSVRVYPSTRFATINKQSVLEARVEFLDEVGDPIKAAGTLRFKLYNANNTAVVSDAQLLFQWDRELITKKHNVKFYDRVTQAYLFHLGVHKLPAEISKVVLRVEFAPAYGDTLNGGAVIQTPK